MKVATVVQRHVQEQHCRKPHQRGSHGHCSHSSGSRDLRHNELQERYKMKHNGHSMDVLTDTKSLTDVLKSPQLPNIWDVSPMVHAITLEHTDMQGSIYMCGGVGHMGGI